MVDVMVKSKKDKPLKLLCLETMNNTMLIVQIKRIDLSKKQFYYLVPIFWKKKKKRKIWLGHMTLNREKKGTAL